MKKEEILRYCLTKPGAYLAHPFGYIPICVKAEGKIFAELYPREEDFKITLRCEQMLADFYRQQFPQAVVRGYHCPPVQQPYKNTIYIDRIDDQLLYDMIDHSYEQVIKKMTKKERFHLIGALDQKTLLSQGALYISRIEEGYRDYDAKELSREPDEAEEELRQIWEQNGTEDAYVDWYYGTLSAEEKERLRTVLSDANREVLLLYEAHKDLMYLPLNKELFALTMEWNRKEALFSTYYFCKEPCTVWANYQNLYTCFRKKNV
ncbi:MmcQ/YjbR family DNA-binding protein [Anaerosporobacter faecicola]|uniref:MmcQ/YjbR family DNA-binding protein n=1 Tax=Anaerosporobacter faecicola TaxID=2718714 RepID=UPI00143C6E37|nr:MmcQ/YjbR family DNA-binding protein [Anaerosporobacter faecicola]